MTSVFFLETFVLVSIGLGSAVFILVAVLPTVLPRAMAAARKQWADVLEEAKKETPKEPGKFAEMVASLSRKVTNLDIHLSDIRRGIKFGEGSAIAFFGTGLLGLYYLALSPTLDSTGVLQAPSGQGGDLSLLLLFFLGILMMALFGASFFRIVDLYLRGELTDRPETKPEFVTGK